MVIARDFRGRRRRWLATPLLLVAAMLMSACVDIEVASEYREDSSASHVVQLRIEHVPADRSESDDLNAVLRDLEQRSIDSGLAFERIDESGLTTVRITAETDEGQEAGAALNSLINATGINITPGVTAPFRGTFSRETGAIGGSSYHLDLAVDGGLLFDSVVTDRFSGTPAEQRSAVSMTYVATFPGDVTATSGEKVNDRSVRWDIPFEGETDLSATARTGGVGAAALFIVVGIAAAIVILIVAIGFGRYFAGRQRISTTLGGAIHRLPGQQTITREGVWVAARFNALVQRLTGRKPKPPAQEK